MVLAAHGTRSAEGRKQVRALLEAVRSHDPAREVWLGHVDVQGPTLDEAIAAASSPPVVAPLFLSAGVHVRTDVAAAAGRRPGTVVGRRLGAHPVIVTLLAEQVRVVMPDPDLPVALVAAGSSDPRARAEVAALARALAHRTGIHVEPAFLTGSGPRASDVVPRSAGALSLLLAPGHFATRLDELGQVHGIRVSPPLLTETAAVDAIARSLLT
ncbi:MAG TPA: CbiX/SirB N-terminal domain-containing protein [Phycicoccus sp.]|mgnify:FL=1|jgi:sirohydrochlorin ferrochelatase|nr:CbiX/SirB N-terminal domain-containing protein [Phycicoccus sp.]HRA46168.1 CbiX/SirB N-terminal domain-containing protein [Phycicoccus sp.]